jgi:pheromone shutdown-related protein TraB
MNTFRNIYLLGTSHIASKSVQQVKECFETIKPEIAAIELDEGRAYSLKHKVKKPKNWDLLRSLGLGGFMFYIFGEFVQKKLGKIVNMEPGSEMLATMKEAEKANAQIVFIDQDIRITLQRFSRYFRKREILKMIIDATFGSLKKEKMTMDLSQVPSEENLEMILGEAKKRYPSLFKILVDERDSFMAKRLFLLSIQNPDKKILAVTGAGHTKGIMSYLGKYESPMKDMTKN